ncbi:MAG: hypothetical protein ACOX1P_21375 [Thermoguttaceae bacterium]|jgi:hypothetical protein
MLLWFYWGSVVLLVAAGAVAVFLAIRKRAFRPLTTLELATLALMICLLHVAVVPWQMALAKVPGLDALVFSIPYTAILLLGLRLVPKPGAATLLIFGQGLFGQILGRGINPAWWPYYLMCAVGIEVLLLLAGNALRSFWTMLAAGVLRGAVAYSYMYLLLAPFLWHQFYAWWYVGLKVSLGIVGCTIGAWLAWRLAPIVEKATRFG